MSAKAHSILSAALSLSGLASIMCVWLAGSPKYAAFSRITQMLGLSNLIIISLLLFAGSVVLILRHPKKQMLSKLAPLMVLLASASPLLFLLFILAARFYQAAVLGDYS